MWEYEFLPEARKEYLKLDKSVRVQLLKAMDKVSVNPLPVNNGGYGHPLANHNGTELAGFLKIKLRAAGIRVVYKLEQRDGKMLVIVIGMRADDEVYETAAKRIEKYGL